ncbi:DUF1289 domain-containing protein [Pseudomonas mangiferae]|uniref:DUF1289 domain-containing protein n=1 Tax=Pseudomonas mangiferae TaxID=2593654 RepID=A0A553H0P8_9PSED|nr:DUF1289 domain-containing protein [Pseudomonas mangiferae]TRX75321.1 DUF1289 domain-containing protein [Pseudomonas mangiferae]
MGADGRPASPCRRQCCLDDVQVCLGCGRTLGEIREWRDASDGRRLQIVEAARVRRPATLLPSGAALT